jgi:maltooligosyltrehalose trehalohydrolase
LTLEFQRSLPIGAEVLPDGSGVSFRLWAPHRQRVSIFLRGESGNIIVPLRKDAKTGYFEGVSERAGAGSRYLCSLDDDPQLYPDPASRFQPFGPHAESEVVDPRTFPWTDQGWAGIAKEGQVIYELHFGTFTREGTFRAAEAQLRELAGIGITVLEAMPIAEFDGSFGWGYDGVDIFAPSHLYGGPGDFRHFVDRAHAAGLGVILDVVYNHFGPSGSYHDRFSPEYFTDRYPNEWGRAIAFDGERAGPVREFFVSNARYWIEEFHLDGLRLDATQQIFDNSKKHVIAEVVEAVRSAGGGRSTYIVAENETQRAQLAREPSAGGYGVDVVWNDDFHRSAVVALTGRSEAYYSDYRGKPQEFISSAKHGFLYQGQWFSWQKKMRGEPAFDLAPPTFVDFLQNHDQVANSLRGERIHLLTHPGRYRAMTALLLLIPSTPLLFQGQEFASSSPFLFFADHRDDGGLAKAVEKGRFEFLRQFPTISAPTSQSLLSIPNHPATFLKCKLDFTERDENKDVYDMHKDLLRLRREDKTFSGKTLPPSQLDGAVLSEGAFVLRYISEDDDDHRLIVVNLGADLRLEPMPEPLLAAPRGRRWRLIWSSEDPRYGGRGAVEVDFAENRVIPGESAEVFMPSSSPTLAPERGIGASP